MSAEGTNPNDVLLLAHEVPLLNGADVHAASYGRFPPGGFGLVLVELSGQVVAVQRQISGRVILHVLVWVGIVPCQFAIRGIAVHLAIEQFSICPVADCSAVVRFAPQRRSNDGISRDRDRDGTLHAAANKPDADPSPGPI